MNYYLDINQFQGVFTPRDYSWTTFYLMHHIKKLI